MSLQSLCFFGREGSASPLRAKAAVTRISESNEISNHHRGSLLICTRSVYRALPACARRSRSAECAATTLVTTLEIYSSTWYLSPHVGHEEVSAFTHASPKAEGKSAGLTEGESP